MSVESSNYLGRDQDNLVNRTALVLSSSLNVDQTKSAGKPLNLFIG
jgi:hypothetical protein